MLRFLQSAPFNLASQKLICVNCFHHQFVNFKSFSQLAIESESCILNINKENSALKSSFILLSRLKYKSFSTQKANRIDYYRILGLESTATQSQIKSAYYEKSKKYHPDVTTDKRSHDLFQIVNEAYTILGNIRNRRMYDKGMFKTRDTRVYDESDFTDSKNERSHKPKTTSTPRIRTMVNNFDSQQKTMYSQLIARDRERIRGIKMSQEAAKKTMKAELGHESDFAFPVSFLLFLFSCLFIMFMTLVPERHNDSIQSRRR